MIQEKGSEAHHRSLIRMALEADLPSFADDEAYLAGFFRISLGSGEK